MWIQRTRSSRAWLQISEVTSVLCVFTVCEEAIANRGSADGYDTGFADIFSSPA